MASRQDDRRSGRGLKYDAGGPGSGASVSEKYRTTIEEPDARVTCGPLRFTLVGHAARILYIETQRGFPIIVERAVAAHTESRSDARRSRSRARLLGATRPDR